MTLVRFSRERDLLRDETVQLSDQVSALTRELSAVESQLSEQLERTQKCQSEAATVVAEARMKSEDAEQELRRVKEVSIS